MTQRENEPEEPGEDSKGEDSTPETEILGTVLAVLFPLALFVLLVVAMALNQEVNGDDSPYPDIPGVPSIGGVPIIP